MSPACTIGSAIATGRCNQIWIYMVATPLGAIAGIGALMLQLSCSYKQVRNFKECSKSYQ